MNRTFQLLSFVAFDVSCLADDVVFEIFLSRNNSSQRFLACYAYSTIRSIFTIVDLINDEMSLRWCTDAAQDRVINDRWDIPQPRVTRTEDSRLVSLRGARDLSDAYKSRLICDRKLESCVGCRCICYWCAMKKEWSRFIIHYNF